MAKLRNLSGERFNSLTVLDSHEIRGKKTYWLCRCDCGVEKYIESYNLKSGSTKSCGCHRNKILVENKKLNLVGERYERLLVKKETSERQGSFVVWECECDCGNLVKVPTGNLTSGNTKSCGCLGSSYGELKVKEFFDKHNITFHKEVTFPDLVGQSGGKLRFDFLVKNGTETILIEYDGLQHSQPSFDFGGEDSFKITLLHDKMKNDFCKDNNIRLIRINDISKIPSELEFLI